MFDAEKIRNSIFSVIGSAPARVNADGKIHRFSTDRRKASDDAGWYVIPDAAKFSSLVIFGDWRSGGAHVMNDGREANAESNREIAEAIQRSRADYRIEKQKMKRKAVHRTRYCIDNSTPINPVNVPYLANKYLDDTLDGVFGAYYYQGRLVIPVTSINGELLGGQYIDCQSGKKLFATGTAKEGGMFWLNNKRPDGGYNGTIVVVEGYATGAAYQIIAKDSKSPLCVAFDAGNVPKVVRELLSFFPAANILVQADDDKPNPRNGEKAGIKYAMQAAKINPSRVSIELPEWPNGNRPDWATDLSDLHIINMAAIEAAEEDKARTENY